MTAFLDFLNTFAIWIYIAGVIGVLFGIKMLFDARRAARTTLFTLEQEQASDRAFRAVLVMVAFTIVIAGVASVNQFVSPALPTPSPLIEPTQPSYTPPVILDTATPQPSSTPLPPTQPPQATLAPTKPQPSPAVTVAQTQPPQPTAAATQPPPPTAVPPTAALIYPQPPLDTPPDGDSIGSARLIIFGWGVDQYDNQVIPTSLPADQWYRVSIEFADKTTNQPRALVECFHESRIDTRTWGDVLDTRGNVADAAYSWYVQAVRAPDHGTCQSGSGSPLSPRSPVFKFTLR